MKYSLFLFMCLPLIAHAQNTVEAQPAPQAEAAGIGPVLDPLDSYRDAIAAIEKHVAAQGAPVETATPPGALSLDARQCVAMALSQNATVSMAQDEVDAAKARIGQARSAMFPQVTGRLTRTHTEFNKPNPSPFWMKALVGVGSSFSVDSTLDTGNTLVDTGVPIIAKSLTSKLTARMTPDTTPDDDLLTSQVNIQQVVYAGGQIRAAIEASQYLAQSQEWQKKATLAELEYQAKQAFYDAVLAEALVRVAEESVTTYERTLSDAQQMLDVGMASNFDVLRAKTELGNRKANLVAARNLQSLSLTNLRRILYLPQDTPIAINPRLEWLPFAMDVKELVDTAYKQRPEISALESGIKAAEQNLRRVDGQYKPQVAATAGYSDTKGGSFATPDGWTMSVGAQWELYAGGRRHFERTESKAQIDRLRHQMQDLEHLVELDVTQSYIQLQDAMAKIPSEQGTVELAREGLRLAQLRFKEGVGTPSETLDAELALTSAETNLVQALRDYAVANAALERATGNSWGPSEETAEEAQPAS